MSETVSVRRGLCVGALAGAVVIAAAGCGTGVAGKAVEAAGGSASATPSGTGSRPGGSASASASPTTPKAPAPTDAEALRIVRAVDLGPTTPSGELDEVAAAKQLAEPMLSIVKASWRLEKPEYRMGGALEDLDDPLVYRTAPAANGDRWFMVVDRATKDQPVYVFRATAADPAWKLAFASYMVDNVDGRRFLGLNEDKNGAAEIVSSAAGLAADPAKVCAESTDETPSKTYGWGPNEAAAEAATAKAVAESAKHGAKTTVTRKLRPEQVGPVWRYGDGGALVPCLRENAWTETMKPGQAITWDGKSPFKDDTPDFAVTSYTRTNISMELIWVPPTIGTASSMPDLAASDAYLYDFTFKEAKR
ncbi:hypothetical protein [Yinghuangia seranimata]|uniref:hypothetical protein n=1 Tax=Yinghuangia seranimata TaxID=408067 RepID=UPI00248B0623|nr:hypothetical protein [Yinghuangia seranimata]MDI2129037.1 hypothetical protein [Yinghuangia seranimata]